MSNIVPRDWNRVLLAMRVDRVDLELLGILEVDGRKSFAALGELTGLSKTSSWSRVQAMERAGIITGYKANIDPVALGLALIAYVSVLIDPIKRGAFEQAVIDHPAVLACSTVAGDADYMLKVACADVGKLDDMLRNTISLMPGVQRSSTTVCLKTIKGSGCLAAAAARV